MDRNYRVLRVAELSRSTASRKKRTSYQTITVCQKVKIARYMHLRMAICEYFTPEYLNTPVSSIHKFKNIKFVNMEIHEI